MSSQGIASAIKRRTRPPEDPRKTASLSSQQQSSSPGNSKLSVNPMQILYSHEMKIKKMEEQLTNNATSNNTNTNNNNTNNNNTISRDEISGLVTSVLDTKLKDIDFQYSEKINKINHNIGVLVKNIETLSKNFGTLNNGLGQYKAENEEKIGNLFNSFKDLNGVLSQNLEYTKELASMRETIKSDILNELNATTSTEEANEVKLESVESTSEEINMEPEVSTEEENTNTNAEVEAVEEELKVEEEVKIKTEAVEANINTEEVTTEAETRAETREKVDSDLNVEEKSMTLDISIPTPKTQRKGKR